MPGCKKPIIFLCMEEPRPNLRLFHGLCCVKTSLLIPKVNGNMIPNFI